MNKKYIKIAIFYLIICFVIFGCTGTINNNTGNDDDDGDNGDVDLYKTYILNTSSGTYDIAVENNIIYAANANGLTIYDVSVLKNISILGETVISSGTPIDVEITDNTAYVALQNNQFSVIDISDKTNPVFIGYFNTSGTKTIDIEVDTAENLLFVAS